MSDRYSQLFARYAATTDVAAVPETTLHEVKRRILDSIGVATAAFTEDSPLAARTYASAFPDVNGATIWGTSQRANPEIAGFANGVAVRYLDFNDTYLSKEPLHPSDVIAALIALAEVRGSTTEELLAAIAVAYEIPVTLCDAASLRAKGWDHVNYLAIGAAAGAGRLLGLDADRIEHAISIATVPHAAMRQTRVGELSMWKGAAAANATRNAIFAALLAEAGMTGPNEPFEGEMGFWWQLLQGDGIEDEVLWRLRDGAPPTRVLDTYIKFWPVEYHAQSAVDAALQLRGEIGPDTSKIVSIRIDTFATSYEIIAKDPEKWDPHTRETADHSIQYIVCAALEDGEVTMATFDLDRIRRPSTLELLQHRTTVEQDDELTAGYPEGIPNRVTVTTSDGLEHVREVRYPRGHAKNPMTDQELTHKFRTNVDVHWSDERADLVAEHVWNLEEASTLDHLLEQLRIEEGKR
ncbi:MAG: MmgE/PrpD family protein [Actinomycetota bacterium]